MHARPQDSGRACGAKKGSVPQMKRILASVTIIAALALSIVGLTIAWQYETENRQLSAISASLNVELANGGSLLDLTQLKPGEDSEPVSLPFTVTNRSSIPVTASFLLGPESDKADELLPYLDYEFRSAGTEGAFTEIVLSAGQELRCSLHVKGIREGFEPNASGSYNYAEAGFSIAVFASQIEEG